MSDYVRSDLLLGAFMGQISGDGSGRMKRGAKGIRGLRLVPVAPLAVAVTAADVSAILVPVEPPSVPVAAPSPRVRPGRSVRTEKQKARARIRTAKKKAKDCRVVPGIEALALDPCAYCGDPVATTHDHIVPFSKGGTHELDNLVRCCWRCNKAKGTRSLLTFLALRAAA